MIEEINKNNRLNKALEEKKLREQIINEKRELTEAQRRKDAQMDAEYIRKAELAMEAEKLKA